MGRKLRYPGPSERAEIERLHNGGAPAAAIAELMVNSFSLFKTTHTFDRIKSVIEYKKPGVLINLIQPQVFKRLHSY